MVQFLGLCDVVGKWDPKVRVVSSLTAAVVDPQDIFFWYIWPWSQHASLCANTPRILNAWATWKNFMCDRSRALWSAQPDPQFSMSCSGVRMIELRVLATLIVMARAHNRILLGMVRSQCHAPCGRVRDLRNNQLSGTIPNSLGTANSLTALYVLWWAGQHGRVVWSKLSFVIRNWQRRALAWEW